MVSFRVFCQYVVQLIFFFSWLQFFFFFVFLRTYTLLHTNGNQTKQYVWLCIYMFVSFLAFIYMIFICLFLFYIYIYIYIYIWVLWCVFVLPNLAMPHNSGVGSAFRPIQHANHSDSHDGSCGKQEMASSDSNNETRSNAGKLTTSQNRFFLYQ